MFTAVHIYALRLEFIVVVSVFGESGNKVVVVTFVRVLVFVRLTRQKRSMTSN